MKKQNREERGVKNRTERRRSEEQNKRGGVKNRTREEEE